MYWNFNMECSLQKLWPCREISDLPAKINFEVPLPIGTVFSLFLRSSFPHPSPLKSGARGEFPLVHFSQRPWLQISSFPTTSMIELILH